MNHFLEKHLWFFLNLESGSLSIIRIKPFANVLYKIFNNILNNFIMTVNILKIGTDHGRSTVLLCYSWPIPIPTIYTVNYIYHVTSCWHFALQREHIHNSIFLYMPILHTNLLCSRLYRDKFGPCDFIHYNEQNNTEGPL